MREEVNVKRIVNMVCLAILLIFGFVLLFSSAYNISDNEKAVVETFGKPKLVEGKKGFRWKVPLIQKVYKIGTGSRSMTIGYDLTTNTSIAKESLMITKDYNFVNVDFYIDYYVVDPVKALYASENFDLILKNLAQSYIRDTVGLYGVDEVITTEKNKIESEVKRKLTERLIVEDIGIAIQDVSLQDAEPPEEVLDSFNAVETAKQDKESVINTARKYRNEKLPEAEAAVQRITSEAETEKNSRINEARGQVARFNALYEQYKNFPLITKQRMFYETMNEVLPDLKIIIDNTESGISKILPLSDLNLTGTLESKGGNEDE